MIDILKLFVVTVNMIFGIWQTIETYNTFIEDVDYNKNLLHLLASILILLLGTIVFVSLISQLMACKYSV